MTDQRTAVLQEAKRRAGECIARGELRAAIVSMIEDLARHRLFTDCPTLAFLELAGLHQVIRGKAAVQRWIDGFA